MAAKSANTRILLFKTPKEDGSDPYVEVLKSKSFHALCVGVLGFQFRNLERLQETLANPESYSAVVLTSQRSAEAIAMATKYMSADVEWRKLPVYVVGKATAKLAEELGFTTIKGANSGNAENLGNVLLSDIRSISETILFPCGNLRKETIPEILTSNNIKFEDITVYETVADSALQDNLKSYLRQGHPDVVVYFSPSGVMFTSGVWRDLKVSKDTLKCLAIGPTTEKCLKDNNYQVVATAAHPTPESVMEALENIKL